MTLLARPDAPAAIAERRRNRPDLILVAAMVVLAAVGLLMIYSVTKVGLERSNLPAFESMERQMIFVAAGLIAFVVASFIDYREYSHLVPYIYGVVLFLLGVVFLFPAVKGAQRWIDLGPFQLQPSEFAKVACVIALAAILARPRVKLPWSVIGRVLLLVAVPGVLIFFQPDLGTMLVFGFLTLVMLFMAGLSWRQMLLLSGVAALGTFAIFRLGLVRDYQLNRLRVLLDPALDPQGIGWNLRQSRIAIGSGQLLGKGLFQGQQTNFEFVPEQGSDFIFTAVGEQLGFIGGLLLVLAYALIVWRLLVIATNSRDRFGAMICVGVAAIIAFHAFINIGMTMGIMPVTGLPLPFVSSGGSSFLAFAFALGIANSIWLRRSPLPPEFRDS
jgi:rod shape determining protein RodA